MKLGLTNVNGSFNKVIEINTIEQLIELMKEYDNPIILEENTAYNTAWNDVSQEYRKCKYTLEIYDDYRE